MFTQVSRRRLSLLVCFVAVCSWSSVDAFGQQTVELSRATTKTTNNAIAPSFEKVDPPSWWARSTLKTVRLLIKGQNLHAGVTLEPNSPDLQTFNYRSSENGHYLFADLLIKDSAKPGQYQLTLKKGDLLGASFPFTVVETLADDDKPEGYSPDDVIYFVMPDRFVDGDAKNNAPEKSPNLYDRTKSRHYHGGDLKGLISQLPYIKSLGATAIWTTPIYDNNDGLDYKEAYPNAKNVVEPSTGYHGYGAIDMYGVDEHLGDMATLKEFIDAAHKLGLKVIQDQVANHTGPYHAWANDPPTPTWWNGTLENHKANNWQKWTAMNPRATRQTQELNTDGWFIDILPDFNQDDPEVEKYLIQNSIWWLRMAGFDAIRMDTLPHVPRRFWGVWGAAIKKEFPETKILGELFDSDPVLLSYYQTGRDGRDGVDTNIDTLFDFGLFGPIRNAFAKGKTIREVHQMFARDWLYPNADVLTTFVGVHDMLRFMSEDGATIEGLQLAFTLVMTSRGTPIIYYGDEIAMRGGGDPDNRRDFPGGFPGDKRSAFTEAGRSAEENQVWNHLARLGQLRSEYKALRRGKSLDLLDAEQQYAYARVDGAQSVVVVINNDTAAATVSVDVSMLPNETLRGGWSAQFVDALGKSPAFAVEKGRGTVTLPARSSAIYVLD